MRDHRPMLTPYGFTFTEKLPRPELLAAQNSVRSSIRNGETVIPAVDHLCDRVTAFAILATGGFND